MDYKENNNTLEEVVFCISMILILGGISYSFAPAHGPFIYISSSDTSANHAQVIMHDFYTSFLATNGNKYDSNNFIMALAAMPSLHTAHTTALYYYARRDFRKISYLYIPVVIFIITEAITSKWHYSLDILFGLVLAVICIACTK